MRKKRIVHPPNPSACSKLKGLYCSGLKRMKKMISLFLLASSLCVAMEKGDLHERIKNICEMLHNHLPIGTPIKRSEGAKNFLTKTKSKEVWLLLKQPFLVQDFEAVLKSLEQVDFNTMQRKDVTDEQKELYRFLVSLNQTNDLFKVTFQKYIADDNSIDTHFASEQDVDCVGATYEQISDVFAVVSPN